MSQPGVTTSGLSDRLEEIAAAAIAAMLAAAGIVWLIAQVASLATNARALPLSLAQAARAALAWPSHASDPAAAFPHPARPALPGAIGMYAAALIVIALSAAVIALGLRAYRRLRPTRKGFATPADVRRSLSSRAATGRNGAGRRHCAPAGIYLGRERSTGRRLYGASEDSYLYLGPPRSGKGVHLIIPQTLAAPGPTLVTSTRPDTLRHTLPLRAELGPVVVFDPQGLAGDLPRLRWAPQKGCTDPLLAIGRARALAAGAQLVGAGGATDGAFWQQMTEAVLRCYLHAADLSGSSMRDVLGWVARPADPAPLRILRKAAGAAPGWAEELAAQTAADPRQRDSVWAGVRRAVDALADPRVLDACSPAGEDAFDAEYFLRNRGTLYLLGTTGAQLSIAPLITALVEDLVDAARRLAARETDGRLDPPLTLLLDEAANIAPIPSLPNLLADGGGSGITTVCVLQSLAQARSRWGQPGADAMWDSATTKVVLGGLAQVDDLTRISRLAGDVDEDTRTRSTGPGGGSTSIAARRTPALPVEQLRCLPPGHAVVLARRTPPVHAVLTPWWASPAAPRIRAALQTSDAGPAGTRT